MNKNSIVGFLLIAAIMVGYSIWMSPSKEELAREKQKQDSIAQVMQRQNDSLKAAQAIQHQNQKPAASTTTTTRQPIATPTAQTAVQNNTPFSSDLKGDNGYYTVHTDLATYEISKKGGFIRSVDLKKYKTWDGKPLILFDPKTTHFGISFFADNQVVNTKDLYFQLVNNDSTEKDFTVAGKNKLTLHFRVYAHAPQPGQKQAYVEYAYTFTGDQYMLGFKLKMENMHGIVPPTMNYVELKWYADMLQQEKAVDKFNGSTIYYKYYNNDVDYLSENKDVEKEIKTKLKWASFKLRFFSSSIIADQYFDDGVLRTNEIKGHKPAENYLTSMSTDLTLPYNPMSTSNSIGLRFYFGPNDFTILHHYGMELDHQIPIGWGFFLLAWINEYIVIPVFNWLGGYGWNYGIVILILTILLKTLLFSIAYKTYMSSAKMRVLKPEVDAIGAKYPKKEDAMKKQQAVMALYRKAGANPASGCLPMLLQMPILFAMFRFFPAAIQLRQQPFLWAHDLSSYDSILHLPWNIPFYGDHVSLFTLLMTITTVMYTYMNNKMMGSAQTQTLPGMKTMMYIMPVMFLGFFNGYAAGLSYYYFLVNIITFLQMFLFQKFINEDKLRKRIELNKKKPVKKSGFQKRLEEAAKKKGYPAK
ncbi:MAG: membrane protein insertase YidC [Bacteroidales bacterium]|nr:membrane protein insertase YidC [Bacteroidales bacterium]